MVQYSGSQVHLDMLKVDFHMTSKKKRFERLPVSTNLVLLFLKTRQLRVRLNLGMFFSQHHIGSDYLC